MKKRIRADEAFEQALQGGLPPASDEIARMQKLATALGGAAAASSPPDQRFRARLRNELLAAAAYQAAQEEELFAALLEGEAAQAPAEMRQLVKVAAALEPADLPALSPTFRFQLRNKLIAAAVPSRSMAMRVADAVAAWNTRMRRNFRVMGAMSVAVFMLLGAGASLAASRDALPGDFLYPLKRFQESAQLVGTSGAGRGEQLLALARVRLAEVDALLDRGEQEADLYSDTLNTMDDLTGEGRDLMLEHFNRVGEAWVLRSLRDFAQEQASDLRLIAPRLPPAARPIAEESLINIESIAADAQQRLVALCDACQRANGGTPVGPSLGTDGSAIGCACEEGDVSTQGSGSTGPRPEPTTDPTSSPAPDPSEKNDIEADEPSVNLPDLPGGADEPGEDLIDDIIDPVESILPTPLPSATLPAVPSL